MIEASTGAVLSTHRVSSNPRLEICAEVMFSERDPPVVHITNMMEGTPGPVGPDDVVLVHEIGTTLDRDTTGRAAGNAVQRCGRPPVCHHGEAGL